MPSPTNDRLQGVVTSVAVKAPVRAATTAAITLFGLQTVDGVTLASGDRVLVKDQSSALDNGIWTATADDWTRALDFNGALDAVGGTLVYVNQGSTNGNTYWRVSGDGAKTPGADSITFGKSLLGDLSSILYTPLGVSAESAISDLYTKASPFGRTAPDSDLEWAPITIIGQGANGPVYSDDPVNYAYANETNDGMFSEGFHIAPFPIGDDFSGDGTIEAPWQTINKAIYASPYRTNIHLYPNPDGSAPNFDVFSIRPDVSADACAKLRVLISHCSPQQPARIKRPCDDISLDAIAKGTVEINLGGAVKENDTVGIGSDTLTYKASPSGPLDILLDPGDGRNEWAQGLASTINANTRSLGVRARIILPEEITDPGIVLIQSNTPGPNGNSIALSATSTDGILVASGTSLEGGGTGWTSEGDGVFSFQTTESYDAPRAVINNCVFDPWSGLETPLAYYGNMRPLDFSGQPSPGDNFECTSGLNGDTRRLTFVASGGGTFDINTGLGTVNIGSTLADTIANFNSLLNSVALLFGLVADAGTGQSRLWARLNANPTITATVSGANLSLGSQVDGKDSLATFAQVGDSIPMSFMAVGGWAFDEATFKLYVKLAGNLDVQEYKANLELIVGDGFTARCFITGARIAFLGPFQTRGTYFATFPYATDPTTYPTRVWGLTTNAATVPAGFISPMDAGMFELSGEQAVWQGAEGVYSTVDTYHITESAKTQVLDGGSQFAGDPYTFSIVEYPQRNALSPHGDDASTAVFNFRAARSLGPLLGANGKFWIVSTVCRQSWGIGGNQYGLYGVEGATYYADSSCFAGNVDGDVRFEDGANFEFRLGAGTKDQDGTAYVPEAPTA